MKSKNSLKKPAVFSPVPRSGYRPSSYCSSSLPRAAAEIQRGLERWLIYEGAEQARVEDADFNHFIGHFAVRNIQVTVGSSRTLLVSQANMNFALLPLLRKQLVINEIRLRDSMLIVERTTDGH